jgi:hypothetical protein
MDGNCRICMEKTESWLSLKREEGVLEKYAWGLGLSPFLDETIGSVPKRPSGGCQSGRGSFLSISTRLEASAVSARARGAAILQDGRAKQKPQIMGDGHGPFLQRKNANVPRSSLFLHG